jgi:hypothetical protein
MCSVKKENKEDATEQSWQMIAHISSFYNVGLVLICDCGDKELFKQAQKHKLEVILSTNYRSGSARVLFYSLVSTIRTTRAFILYECSSLSRFSRMGTLQRTTLSLFVEPKPNQCHDSVHPFSNTTFTELTTVPDGHPSKR